MNPKLNRWLHLLHRWLGIASGVLVLLWFASGMVMMYVGYPQLDDSERRAALPVLDPATIRATPEQAWQATGQTGLPQTIHLRMLATAQAVRPAYVFNQHGSPLVVWADGGELRKTVTAADASTAAQAMRPGHVSALDRIELDQWSISLDAHRPLYRVALDDAAGSTLYVSSRTGEVVRDTDRNERGWNWLGSVLHWIYFAPLRAEREWWRQVILWTSALAFAIPLSGAVLGLQRLRLRRPYSGKRVTPYTGWKRWHHLLGLGISVFALTWLFSGWLSVNPFAWFDGKSSREQDKIALAGGGFSRADLAINPAAALARQSGTVEIEWLRFDGKTYLRLHGKDAAASSLIANDDFSPRTFSRETLLAAAHKARPADAIAASAWLGEGDLYYYRHHDDKPLPVLRVDYADTARTSLYLDPSSGQMVGHVDSNRRLYRWLFSGLHQLDFHFLFAYRPLWDIVLLTLLLCGTALSCTGLLLAWRRLSRRHTRARP